MSRKLSWVEPITLILAKMESEFHVVTFTA